ncbi:MAG: hypothetical protein WCX33_01810, partial [Candidatus Shapirobacteria bacterium]
LVISFLTILFLNPSVIFAQNSSSNQKNNLNQIWQNTTNWFSNFFGISKYFTNHKSVTTQILSQSDQIFNKGVYLNGVINGDYQDFTIAYTCNQTCTFQKTNPNCKDIKLSTLVYFFYQKGQKILYQINNSQTPIDYDSNKINRFKTQLITDDSCYQNLYNGLPNIPQGKYAGISSEQLNNSLRTIIPASAQGEDLPLDSSDIIIIKDNDKQEKTMLLQIIPDNDQTNSESINNRSQLRENFTNWLYPASWQKNP